MTDNLDASSFHLAASALDERGEEGRVASSKRVKLVVRLPPNSEEARRFVVKRANEIRVLLKVGSMCPSLSKSSKLLTKGTVTECSDSQYGASFIIEFDEPIHHKSVVTWVGAQLTLAAQSKEVSIAS